ncbi:hypothetical protein IWX47DRAFT_542753 [Phyllosticta citricarpa]
MVVSPSVEAHSAAGARMWIRTGRKFGARVLENCPPAARWARSCVSSKKERRVGVDVSMQLSSAPWAACDRGFAARCHLSQHQQSTKSDGNAEARRWRKEGLHPCHCRIPGRRRCPKQAARRRLCASQPFSSRPLLLRRNSAVMAVTVDTRCRTAYSALRGPPALGVWAWSSDGAECKDDEVYLCSSYRPSTLPPVSHIQPRPPPNP